MALPGSEIVAKNKSHECSAVKHPGVKYQGTQCLVARGCILQKQQKQERAIYFQTVGQEPALAPLANIAIFGVLPPRDKW